MIDTFLEEQLKPVSLSREEFSEVVIRLLDYGVICREESHIEATLYDRYLQCANIVEDYLAVIGVRIQHDKQFNFIRVFPPGSNVPGMADEDSSPFNSGFRAKPNQQEVATIIVLRAEYEKSLREGQVDEKGRAMLSLEGLAIAMNNLLKRPLPEGLVERKNLFRRLRQLRLVQFNTEDDLDNSESWLSIQPSITSFVSDEVLSVLSESTPSADALMDDAPRADEQPVESALSHADEQEERDSIIPEIPSALFAEGEPEPEQAAENKSESRTNEVGEAVVEHLAFDPPVQPEPSVKKAAVKRAATKKSAAKAKKTTSTAKAKAPVKKAATAHKKTASTKASGNTKAKAKRGKA